MMRDAHGRQIDYLRISVTDRCNFRCIYCMPKEGLPWLPRDEILRYEEIAEVVRQMVPLGLRKVRITGGEPTIRPEVTTLVRLLRGITELEDIALSTNGVRLRALGTLLRDAGLDRVNVSVDSLRRERIAGLARRDLGFEPISALEAAERAGLSPIKLNMVVMRGINDDEIPAFAELTRDRPWHVRFIELMPVGELADREELRVPIDEILGRVAALGALEAASAPVRGNGPATYFRLPSARGSIGVIAPMSHNFCDRCNRVRLTADGRLRTCLFGDAEVSLREALREGEPLAPLIHAALERKPAGHVLLERRVGGLRALSQVGG
jgi:GTP 3',8-cyclase